MVRSKANLEKAADARAIERMRKLRIPPIAESDREARPDNALAMELRRTVAWIRFCEDKITELSDDEALIFGITERRSERGTRDDADVDVSTLVESAAINGWVERLDFNRKHLLAVTKQWIDAGFEERRLRVEERALDRLETAIDSIVADLGLNPRSADVRQTIRLRLAEVSDIQDAEVVES